MDALLRLGARAIDAPVDAATVVRPMATPIFLPAPQPLVPQPPSDRDAPPSDHLMPRHAADGRGAAAAHWHPASRSEVTPTISRSDRWPLDDTADPVEHAAVHGRHADLDDPDERLPHPDSISRADSLPSIATLDRTATRPTRLSPTPDRVSTADEATHDAGRPSPSRDRASRGDRSDSDVELMTPHAASTPSARMLAALRSIRQSVPAPDRGHERVDRAQRPPAVHVTIGRIEVRSVAAPAAEPPRVAPRPAAPRVTLAEYLSGRRRSTP
jgi:hypothetical protein